MSVNVNVNGDEVANADADANEDANDVIGSIVDMDLLRLLAVVAVVYLNAQVTDGMPREVHSEDVDGGVGGAGTETSL